MITVRHGNERGHLDHGWLDARHSFSFGRYVDREHMGFRTLRVLNEDRIRGGGGFPEHPHENMEILTYVVSGALGHRDSTGHVSTLGAGDAQAMSAGRGIRHSEFNASEDAPVHLLQVWILPEAAGLEPAYAELRGDTRPNAPLRLLASRDGRDGSMRINQDADIHQMKLESGASVRHDLGKGRGAWVQLIAGRLSVNGTTLEAGDAAAVEDEPALDLRALGADAQALVFDLA